MDIYEPLTHRFRWSLLVFFLLPLVVFAQEEKELAQVSRTYALTNATIIQSPGRKIEHGTVVIKNGLLLAVGNVPVPANAIVIKCDSMFVYAGFIDGLSHSGVSKPKEEQSRERAKDPGNPTPERAGMQPQNDVRNFISVTEKSTEETRAIGFTTSQSVPWGIFLPGNAALVLMGGNNVGKMVISSNSSFYSELSAPQGVYPSTVIGVISKWHELYRQASDAFAYEAVYASGRSGLERPASDKILQAFYRVVDKKQPVLFKAEKMLDIYRVLALQSDLGFNLVLGNVKEGWLLADKIKASGAKVFLSLDLPEEKDEDKKDDKKKEKGDKDKKDDKKDAEKKPYEKKPEEKKPEDKSVTPKEKTPAEKEKELLEKRKAETIKKYAGVAAVFQKAGIHFGFSTLGAKAKDIPSNLRKIIAAGLTEDQALEALTTAPAQILGVSDRLGTIDNGKIANLVVTDKPYFNEKSKVRYVFVDGEIYKQEIADGKKDNKVKKDSTDKKSSPKSDITGSWKFTTDAPDGKHESKIVFSKEDAAYAGIISGDRLDKPVAVSALSVTADHLHFTYSVSVGGTMIEVTIDGKYDAKTFDGTSSTKEYGNFTTTGVRDPEK